MFLLKVFGIDVCISITLDILTTPEICLKLYFGAYWLFYLVLNCNNIGILILLLFAIPENELIILFLHHTIATVATLNGYTWVLRGFTLRPTIFGAKYLGWTLPVAIAINGVVPTMFPAVSYWGLWTISVIVIQLTLIIFPGVAFENCDAGKYLDMADAAWLLILAWRLYRVWRDSDNIFTLSYC